MTRRDDLAERVSAELARSGHSEVCGIVITADIALGLLALLRLARQHPIVDEDAMLPALADALTATLLDALRVKGLKAVAEFASQDPARPVETLQ